MPHGHDGPGHDGVQAQREQVDEKDEQDGGGNGERQDLRERGGDVFEGVSGVWKAYRRSGRWREGSVRPGEKCQLPRSYQRPAGSGVAASWRVRRANLSQKLCTEKHVPK